MNPFKVTFELSKFDSHNPHADEQWFTESVTIWASSFAEVRRICRGRFGVIPMTVEPLWVAPETAEA